MSAENFTQAANMSAIVVGLYYLGGLLIAAGIVLSGLGFLLTLAIRNGSNVL
jgi:hypothetical protein